MVDSQKMLKNTLYLAFLILLFSTSPSFVVSLFAKSLDVTLLDLNQDEVINDQDLNIVLQDFAKSSDFNNIKADIDSNGVVNLSDMVVLLQNYKTLNNRTFSGNLSGKFKEKVL